MLVNAPNCVGGRHMSGSERGGVQAIGIFADIAGYSSYSNNEERGGEEGH